MVNSRSNSTGDGGILSIPQEFYRPDRIVLTQGEKRDEFHLPYLGGGYAHEAIHVQDCLFVKTLESDVFPNSLTVPLAGILGQIGATSERQTGFASEVA